MEAEMILTAMTIIVLGQVFLPGGALSLEQAKADARFIVVAEVGKTSGRCDTGPVPFYGRLSYYMWTELKPSAVLKGEVTYEELNRHPLAIRAKRLERLPTTGDELIFFLGDGDRDFVITKIVSKTEQNLEAIRSKTPRRARTEIRGSDQDSHRSAVTGNIGGGLSGGLRRVGWAEAEPEPPSYRGTVIVPDDKATGETLKVQQEFATAMSRADPVPEVRRAHFAWLDKNEYVRRYKMTRIGWYGGVRSVEPRPGGGWVVKISIQPWLYIPYRGMLPDRVEETYDYVDGRLRFTKSDAAVARPAWQTFVQF